MASMNDLTYGCCFFVFPGDILTFLEEYGKIIVSELFLPTHMKTITPVTVGGVAGGEKCIFLAPCVLNLIVFRYST